MSAQSTVGPCHPRRAGGGPRPVLLRRSRCVTFANTTSRAPGVIIERMPRVGLRRCCFASVRASVYVARAAPILPSWGRRFREDERRCLNAGVARTRPTKRMNDCSLFGPTRPVSALCLPPAFAILHRLRARASAPDMGADRQVHTPGDRRRPAVDAVVRRFRAAGRDYTFHHDDMSAACRRRFVRVAPGYYEAGQLRRQPHPKFSLLRAGLDPSSPPSSGPRPVVEPRQHCNQPGRTSRDLRPTSTRPPARPVWLPPDQRVPNGPASPPRTGHG